MSSNYKKKETFSLQIACCALPTVQLLYIMMTIYKNLSISEAANTKCLTLFVDKSLRKLPN